MVAEDLVEVEEEVGAGRDSGTRTEVTAPGAIRQVAALRLAGAGVLVMTAGVRAGAHHQGGESATTVLREAVVVEEGAVRAIRMLATGAIAAIGAVVGTVVDAGGSAKQM